MPDIEQIAKEVDHMYKDLYVGEGKSNPSITVRLSTSEEAIDRIGKNLSKMVWLLVGIFITILADVVVHASGAHL